MLEHARHRVIDIRIDMKNYAKILHHHYHQGDRYPKLIRVDVRQSLSSRRTARRTITQMHMWNWRLLNYHRRRDTDDREQLHRLITIEGIVKRKIDEDDAFYALGRYLDV